MPQSQFLLMKDRRFLPLFVTQFLGAFHDNLFKNAMIILVVYQLASQLGLDAKTQALMSTAATATLVFPFFIFSATAGQLADSFPKHKIIRMVKLVELGIAVLGITALVSESIPLMYVTIFALGTHSAFFSPCKYSILPEHLRNNELIGGNALLNTGTFLAILLGTIFGISLMSLSFGTIAISSLIAVVALGGYVASLYIPAGAAALEPPPFNPNPVSETRSVLKYTFSQHRDVVLSLLGKGWFFCVGSMFLSQFPNYVKISLQAQESILTLFTVLFSIGIGIGGLFNNKLLHGKVAATYVPLAALGLTAFSLDLYMATSHVVHNADQTLMSLGQFVSHLAHWRIILDVCLVSVFGGLFVVPLTAILQERTPAETRARIMAGSAITDSLFMVLSAAVCATLLSASWDVQEIFLAFGLANIAVAIYICRLLPDYLFKTLLQVCFKIFYRVEVKGLENVEKAGKRAVIVGNHGSLLDPPLLAAFLPGRPMFAINTQVAMWWWVKPFLRLVDAFPLDPTNPYSIKSLIHEVEKDRQIVIFPEGRLSSTGSLMKIYDGPGLIADKADAMILPVRLDGVQYTSFTRLRGKVPFKRFPKITITFLEPVKFKIDEKLKGKSRRAASSRQLYDVMETMMMETSNRKQTLWELLLKARDLSGSGFAVVEDVDFSPLTYGKLILKAKVLGAHLARSISFSENVGVMLPNSAGAVVSFFALQAIGGVPAMLNFTAGTHAVLASCKNAQVKTLITSRRFIEAAHLEEMVEVLSQNARILYLEDVAENIGVVDKVRGLLFAKQEKTSPQNPAVILFTSGSEGSPKGVVLSHENLIANIIQLSCRVSFNQRDIVFNCLPMFHSFGLTGGTLLPILSGIRTFLYPNPLHIKIVPELVYATNASILFGTDTFLSGYARVANPYDFYGVRYIFAGAEKVKDSTRKIYMDRFGVRILEGYGATETSPAIAVNSPMHQKEGTVGRPLSGMTLRLDPVTGVEDGGRLLVKGPNVMLGYYKEDLPGVLQPPAEGWHDTGDIVAIDGDGYIKILGRAKRFAKIAGEMVSLAVGEQIAEAVYPEFLHAVVCFPDPRKGEQLVLVTTAHAAQRADLVAYAGANGMTPLAVPARILVVDKIPLLGTGKVDYNAVKALALENSEEGEK